MAFKHISKFISGDRETRLIDYTFPVSYLTGGAALTPAALGLTRGKVRQVIPGMVVTSGVASPTKTAVWDHINNKLLLFTTYPGTQAANASDQSTVSVRLEVKVK